MAKEQPAAKNFPWEGPYPTGPFWDSIPDHYHHMGRSFLRLFSEEEVAAMPLDAGLDEAGKLRQLESIVRARADRFPSLPEELPREDWVLWSRCDGVLRSVLEMEGRLDEAEALLRGNMAAHQRRRALGTDPEMAASRGDLSLVSALSWLLVKQGRLAEAEPVARESLALLRDDERLGFPSPQSLGASRLLMEITGRLGRYDDAKKLNDQGYLEIKELAKGKYAVYEKEEVEAMDEVRANLEKWRVEASA